MSEATLETDVEGLVERLRSSAAAFGKHPIHTADGDPVLLTVQAEELEEAASTLSRLSEQVKALEGERDEAQRLLSAPELHDFASGVVLEAAHQRQRWGSSHDTGKEPQDWFWLLGWLAGKAVVAAQAGDADKALHHTISSAAALANWHAAILGANTTMRPGINPEERGYDAA